MHSVFARSGRTNPFGKVGQSLGVLRLPYKTEARLREEAARAGMPVMEFVRNYLELRLHGRPFVERELTLRLDLVEGRDECAPEPKR